MNGRPTSSSPGFIGSPTMNFFPVELRGEGVVFSEGGATVPLPEESCTPLRKASSGVLEIRPERRGQWQDPRGVQGASQRYRHTESGGL